MTQSTSTATPAYAVKFVPFSSTVDSPFWVKYCNLKLETIRLGEDPIDLVATYGVANGPSSASRLQMAESSLSPDERLANDKAACGGRLLGLNTLEAFSKRDKNELLKEQAEAPTNTTIAFCFLLTFADLKQHKVLYWFGFPAFMCRTPITASLLAPQDIPLAQDLPLRYHQLRWERLGDPSTAHKGLPAFFAATEHQMIALEDTQESLTALTRLLESDNGKTILFGFVDPAGPPPSTSDLEPPMGWPLRTLAAFLSRKAGLGGQTFPVVSWRSPLRRLDATAPPPTMTGDDLATDFAKYYPRTTGTTPLDGLVFLSLAIPEASAYLYPPKEGPADLASSKVVGWEPNARGKPGPRWVNLKPLLDNNHLAIQAADLNLKLMKWRMIPELRVDRLKDTKVLLLGAGTLGCSVGRTLLGWGVRKFTLLDYGTVSYSNPVRQNLFTLEDCHFNNGSGKPKAEAAADALRAIAADVEATGVHLSIPMPGHTETKESIADSVSRLDALVKEADVVYLLTDTRESRWLPTLLAAVHDKILVNAALGLDSWLVMRHGGNPSVQGTRLGCYFCNDVVAPENSTKNRTLDQQCTVTRPGLAPIAASMAVELTVSLLHHPDRQRAPAPSPGASAAGYNPTASGRASEDASSALGVMPHQIRGSLVSYQMMTPTVPAFSCCTGCSPKLVEAYRADPCGLVEQVCASVDGTFLEDLTGLTAFRAEAAEKLAGVDLDDWDEDDELAE